MFHDGFPFLLLHSIHSQRRAFALLLPCPCCFPFHRLHSQSRAFALLLPCLLRFSFHRLYSQRRAFALPACSVFLFTGFTRKDALSRFFCPACSVFLFTGFTRKAALSRFPPAPQALCSLISPFVKSEQAHSDSLSLIISQFSSFSYCRMMVPSAICAASSIPSSCVKVIAF